MALHSRETASLSKGHKEKRNGHRSLKDFPQKYSGGKNPYLRVKTLDKNLA